MPASDQLVVNFGIITVVSTFYAACRGILTSRVKVAVPLGMVVVLVTAWILSYVLGEVVGFWANLKWGLWDHWKESLVVLFLVGLGMAKASQDEDAAEGIPILTSLALGILLWVETDKPRVAQVFGGLGAVVAPAVVAGIVISKLVGSEGRVGHSSTDPGSASASTTG